MENQKQNDTFSAKRIALGAIAAILTAFLLSALAGLLIVKQVLPQQKAFLAVPVIAALSVLIGILAAGRGNRPAVRAITVAVIFCGGCFLAKLLLIPGPLENLPFVLCGSLAGAIIGMLCTAKQKGSTKIRKNRR